MKSVIFAVLLACGASNLISAGEFVPLEMGTYWRYQDRLSGEAFTIEVGQPVWNASGVMYHYLLGYADVPVIARNDEAGNLVALDPETGRERILTAFAGRPGDWWSISGTECLVEGQVQERRVNYTETIGRWRNALSVQYRATGCVDTGTLSEIYAENIGMLRRVAQTLAGPRTFDLVYARIGGQIIETSDRARFSVALERAPSQGFLRATLRIDIGYAPSIALNFDSSQEYDVALRDANGTIVWKWSDGRLFDSGYQVKAIPSVWTQSVDIPLPTGDLSGYAVEGWLTTATGRAQFSATAPVLPPLVDRSSRER